MSKCIAAHQFSTGDEVDREEAWEGRGQKGQGNDSERPQQGLGARVGKSLVGDLAPEAAWES